MDIHPEGDKLSQSKMLPNSRRLLLSVSLAAACTSFGFSVNRLSGNGFLDTRFFASKSDVDIDVTKAKRIVETFRPNKFKPDNIFTANCHWQTVVGSGALAGKIYGDPVRPFRTSVKSIETPDNDFFDIFYTDNVKDADNVVLIFHGLEGTANSSSITNCAVAAINKGFGCILVSFRGCSGKPNRTPGGYHVGFTKDLTQLVEIIHKQYPSKGIFLMGTSLGGNVILKYLGEQGDRARKLNIRGAAVACVPFDPKACQSKIDVGFNRALYSENFLSTLKKKGEEQHARFPGTFDIEGVRKAKTVGDFDDAFIAKIYGFKDKFDYYAKCGSINFLSKIRVPTLAINNIDDPFIDASSLPTEEEHIRGAPVRLVYHEQGGHCGFATSKMSTEPDSPATPPHGWLAEEFTRFLVHARDYEALKREKGNGKGELSLMQSLFILADTTKKVLFA